MEYPSTRAELERKGVSSVFCCDIILLLTQCYYHRGIIRLYPIKSFIFASYMFPPKRFVIFSPCLGDAQKVGVQMFK